MAPLLEVERVTKRFGGLAAVDGVSFGVDQGEILGIIGPNGAGKTTLFGLISGFLAMDEGDVRFAGESIRGRPPPRIAKLGLTRSFQIVQVFAGMTALDAVTAAALLRRPLREALRHAERVLDAVGLGAKASSFPNALSLQDRKLLEVAKCVATEPRLILLDEVMAGLTQGEAQVPLAVIRRLRGEGMTFVLVEHVMPIVMSVCDRIVVLNFGRKVAEGTPREIVQDVSVREAYFGDEAALA